MLNHTSRCKILCLADQLMEYVRWYWTEEEHSKELFIFTSKRPFCIQVYRAKRHQGSTIEDFTLLSFSFLGEIK